MLAEGDHGDCMAVERECSHLITRTCAKRGVSHVSPACSSATTSCKCGDWYSTVVHVFHVSLCSFSRL